MTAQVPVTDAFWMPYTANRDFKKDPRVITGASGHYYNIANGDRLYDMFSGLWTSGIGHCHPKIVAAVQQQVASLGLLHGVPDDQRQSIRVSRARCRYGPGTVSPIVSLPIQGLNLSTRPSKLPLAITVRAAKANRTRLIGREKGYHGVNFGGMSVGGMVPNRKVFSPNLLPGVDHMRHTLDLERNAFSRGQPEHGAELADDLERLAGLHDGSNIAAVIV